MRIAAEIFLEAFERVDKYLEDTNITMGELLLLTEEECKLRLENCLNNR